MYEKRYKTRLDKRVKWITILAILCIICGFCYLFFTSSGSYLPAWFLMLVIGLVAFVALSIPRFVKISPSCVEIHCLMELTTIPYENIKKITLASKYSMRWSLPILGIFGIFGYYGYYFDFSRMKIFRLYARQWNNFVKIEDIYEEVVVISCNNPREFIQNVKQHAPKKVN